MTAAIKSEVSSCKQLDGCCLHPKLKAGFYAMGNLKAERRVA